MWQSEDRLRCECGQPFDESSDAEKATNAYVAEPVVCHACAARERTVKKLTEDGKKPLEPGTKLRVRDQSR